MKIGIDARWIFEEISGIGSYTQELISHLLEIDKSNRYVLIFDNQNVLDRTSRMADLAGHPNAETMLVDYSPFAVRSQLVMPGLIHKLELDVYHAPNYMIPFWAFPKKGAGNTGCVITIHDLIPMIFRDHAPRSKKSRFYPVFKKIMLEAGARADVIIAPSTCSRNDIIKHLQIPEPRHDRVKVIPEGVDERYKPSARKVDSNKLVLYVGRQDPYKNLIALIEAFARVVPSVPNANLRIIGPPDRRYPEAYKRACELEIMPHVDWQGYVDNAGLLSAYQEAAVLVLPTRYEGFGLPVLEAMACGTPVICSNVSSLPEVAGDAALLIDPDNIDELATHLLDVLTHPTISQSLREKGLVRAAQFTWQKTAELTLQAYEAARKTK